MSQVHLHLLITHLPIFAALCGFIVLAYGLYTKSKETQMASYLLLILAAIGAGIGYATGEGAEEAVEGIAGVSETMIEEHEDFALIALVGIIICGVAALLAFILASIRSSFAKTMAIIVLLLSLTSFGLVARTGYLGGQVRHTEVNANATAPAQDNQNKEAHEEE
jgi:uncharacterized membrane protein